MQLHKCNFINQYNGIKAKLVIHFGYLLDCCNFQSNILFRFRRNLKEMNLSIYLLFSAVRTLNGPRYPQGFLGSWRGSAGSAAVLVFPRRHLAVTFRTDLDRLPRQLRSQTAATLPSFWVVMCIMDAWNSE